MEEKIEIGIELVLRNKVVKEIQIEINININTEMKVGQKVEIVADKGSDNESELEKHEIKKWS